MTSPIVGPDQVRPQSMHHVTAIKIPEMSSDDNTCLGMVSNDRLEDKVLEVSSIDITH